MPRGKPKAGKRKRRIGIPKTAPQLKGKQATRANVQNLKNVARMPNKIRKARKKKY